MSQEKASNKALKVALAGTLAFGMVPFVPSQQAEAADAVVFTGDVWDDCGGIKAPAKQLHVTYDLDGGTGFDTSHVYISLQEEATGEFQTMSQPSTVTKDGYTLKGWQVLTSEGGDAEATVEADFKDVNMKQYDTDNNLSVHLKAVWEQTETDSGAVAVGGDEEGIRVAPVVQPETGGYYPEPIEPVPVCPEGNQIDICIQTGEDGEMFYTMDQIIERDGKYLYSAPSHGTKAGYTFVGWQIKGQDVVLDENFKDVDLKPYITNELAGITLIGKWEENKVTPVEDTSDDIKQVPKTLNVIYNLDGGKGFNTSVVYVSVQDEKTGEFETLSQPGTVTKGGYKLVGWQVVSSGDADATIEADFKDVNLKAYDTSDDLELTLKAVWEELVFEDLNAETSHVESINWLAEKGITTGFASKNEETGKVSTDFRPMDEITRADMAAFLYRLSGSPDYTPSDEVKAKFSDVNENTPHAKEIWWMAENMITTGFEDGTFRPYDDVTRCDMSAFIHRMVGDEASASTASEATLTFNDLNAETPHLEDVQWMAENGITQGFSDGSFQPLTTVKRCDMAAFLQRTANAFGLCE